MERRRFVRCEGEELTSIEARLRVSHGSWVRCQVLNSAAGGAAVRVPHVESAVFAVADQVQVRFSAADLPDPLTLAARIEYILEQEGGRQLGLHFNRGGVAVDRLPLRLRPLFNRRRAVRARPDPGTPVEVQIDARAGLWDRGPLVDISEVGLCLEVSLQFEQETAGVVLVDLTVPLPTIPEPLKFAGRIRRRAIQADRVRLGIAFDPDRTPDFRARQKILGAWVAHRSERALPEG